MRGARDQVDIEEDERPAWERGNDEVSETAGDELRFFCDDDDDAVDVRDRECRRTGGVAATGVKLLVRCLDANVDPYKELPDVDRCVDLTDIRLVERSNGSSEPDTARLLGLGTFNRPLGLPLFATTESEA